MNPFRRARALYRFRQLVIRRWGGLGIIGVAILLLHGIFRDLSSGKSTPGIGVLIATVAVVGLLGGQLGAFLRAGGRIRALRREPPENGNDKADGSAEFDAGGVLLAFSAVALQATGGPGSPLYPLFYALIAFLVLFHRPPIGAALVSLALLLETAVCVAAGLPIPGETWVFHAGFIVLFALLYLLFVQSEIARQRREHRVRLLAEIHRSREEARDFRLITSQLSIDSRGRSRAEEQEKLAQGAVETLHQALFYSLELLKKSLDLYTCVLLWLDESGEHLSIKELATDSELIHERQLPIDAGALGSVVKQRQALYLRDPKPGHLPYYDGPEPIGAFLAVPVLEEGHLRGLLCADRRASDTVAARPFEARDELLLVGATRQIVRQVQSERVFAAVERSKYEHERFYRASELLNRALTPDQVFATAFEAARAFVDFDFAAITLYDRASRRHTVAAATGDGAAEVMGLCYSDNAGLVAMVVKNRHYLPAGGELRSAKEPFVFTKKVKLPSMASLVVLPLVCADEAIGSFTLASRRPHRFAKDRREMLGVIANQVAVSTKNAEMYRAMENLATTDGLTGLINHRTFQERLAVLLSRAERHQQRLAVLLTDIDHFKKINDAYGHPTGDAVLRRVAAVCLGEVRKIDLAARYGGEEFAIVLDGTELAGARLLAERIRAEVAAQSFTPANEASSPSEKLLFSCTLSLGIACYPEDGKDAKTLIAHADQSLYNAKDGGRNRSVAWRDLGARSAIRAVK